METQHRRASHTTFEHVLTAFVDSNGVSVDPLSIQAERVREDDAPRAVAANVASPVQLQVTHIHTETGSTGVSSVVSSPGSSVTGPAFAFISAGALSPTAFTSQDLDAPIYESTVYCGSFTEHGAADTGDNDDDRISPRLETTDSVGFEGEVQDVLAAALFDTTHVAVFAVVAVHDEATPPQLLRLMLRRSSRSVVPTPARRWHPDVHQVIFPSTTRRHYVDNVRACGRRSTAEGLVSAMISYLRV